MEKRPKYKELKNEIEKSFDDFLSGRLNIPEIKTVNKIQKGKKVKIDLDYKNTKLKWRRNSVTTLIKG